MHVARLRTRRSQRRSAAEGGRPELGSAGRRSFGGGEDSFGGESSVDLEHTPRSTGGQGGSGGEGGEQQDRQERQERMRQTEMVLGCAKKVGAPHTKWRPGDEARDDPPFSFSQARRKGWTWTSRALARRAFGCSFEEGGRVVHPHTFFMYVWDATVAAFVVLMVVQVPIQIAFTPYAQLASAYENNGSGAAFFLLMNLFVYLLFTGDLMISMRLGYDDAGAVVLDPVAIRRRYVRVRLLLDALAALPLLLWPLELFAFSRCALGSSCAGSAQWATFLAFLNYGRLLLLFKQPSGWAKVMRFYDSLANYFGTLATDMFFLMSALIILTTWYTCLWFSVQAYAPQGDAGEDFYESMSWFPGLRRSWLHSKACDSSDGGADLFDGCPPENVVDPLLNRALGRWLEETEAGWGGDGGRDLPLTFKDKAVLFINCFYWASNAGDGYDTVQTQEKVVAILGQILINNLFYAFILGSIISALQDFHRGWKKKTQYRSKIDSVNEFLDVHRLSEDLKRNTRNFYKAVWLPKEMDFTEKNLQEDLPPYLQHKMMSTIVTDVIRKSAFYKKYFAEAVAKDAAQGHPRRLTELVDNWIQDMSAKFRPSFKQPYEYIIKEGTRGTEMYILKEGTAAIHLRGPNKIVALAGPGEIFGELGMLEIQPRRTASVVTLSNATVYALSQEDFNAILQDMPDDGAAILEIILTVASQRNRSNSARSGSGSGRGAATARAADAAVAAHDAEERAQRQRGRGSLRDPAAIDEN